MRSRTKLVKYSSSHEKDARKTAHFGKPQLANEEGMILN